MSVNIDTTELQDQIKELQSLLATLEGVPQNLVGPLLGNLSAVLNDIVLTDSPSALSAGFKVFHSARLGAKYERFTAAIRAGEFDLKTL